MRSASEPPSSVTSVSEHSEMSPPCSNIGTEAEVVSCRRRDPRMRTAAARGSAAAPELSASSSLSSASALRSSLVLALFCVSSSLGLARVSLAAMTNTLTLCCNRNRCSDLLHPDLGISFVRPTSTASLWLHCGFDNQAVLVIFFYPKQFCSNCAAQSRVPGVVIISDIEQKYRNCLGILRRRRCQ